MAEVTQQQVVEYIKGISVLELSQLVKTLESELGVSAAAAMPTVRQSSDTDLNHVHGRGLSSLIMEQFTHNPGPQLRPGRPARLRLRTHTGSGRPAAARGYL